MLPDFAACFWQDVSTATGSRVRLAVDESLTEACIRNLEGHFHRRSQL